MIAERHLPDVPFSKSSCEKGLCPSIILAFHCLRFVNGTGRHANSLHAIQRQPQKPAKGRILLLKRSQFMLVGNGKTFKVFYRFDVTRPDTAGVKLGPYCRSLLLGVLNDLLKRAVLVISPLFCGQSLQRLVVVGLRLLPSTLLPE